jgi:hypothetical protein
MWKWFLLITITLTLANCGRPPSVDLPTDIDHPPTEEAPPAASNSDGSNTSKSGGVAVASEGVGVNIEIEPVMLRGAILQYSTPDNVNPGT